MTEQGKEIRVVSINLANIGSTGKIVENIRQVGKKENVTVYAAYPPSDACNSQKNGDILIGGKIGRYKSYQMAYYTGFNGCFSIFATIKFLRTLDKIQPNVIHLHNLHHSYINIPLLFDYIKKKRIPVIWTLHDCWAFTGQCAYFTLSKCDKWINGCYACPSYKEYPDSMVDRTVVMWKQKKKWFNNVSQMIIVTPSKWLADLVKKSYLKNYRVQVINNGIDLSLFKPTQSNFRQKHNIPLNVVIVLGVAFGWGVRKGLDVFIELEKRLDSKLYKLVLVGTDSNIDKQLPPSILSIHRTQNQHELAEIYTAADLFVNPTREDNFPTVNIESLACGTPVLTFETGGSSEIIDESCGKSICVNDVNELIQEIEEQRMMRKFTSENCIKRAQYFSDKDKFSEYIKLYKDLADK